LDKTAVKNCKSFPQIYPLRINLFINVLQDILFCVPKVAVLYGKSIGFASQKGSFRNTKA